MLNKNPPNIYDKGGIYNICIMKKIAE